MRALYGFTLMKGTGPMSKNETVKKMFPKMEKTTGWPNLSMSWNNWVSNTEEPAWSVYWTHHSKD